MELPKLIILLCCTYYGLASDEHSHIIPVENYETELQDLGEHVDVHEPPVKVIKITKTVAVKIPVPYPVKVVEKVPYPVHVSKPYPVPVPHIVHVPQPSKPKALGHEEGSHFNQYKPTHESQEHGSLEDSHYQVHESPSQSSSGGHSFVPSAEGYSFHGNLGQGSFGGHEGEHSSADSFGGGAYNGPSGHYGFDADSQGHGSFESKSYDQAINQYLQKHKPSGSFHYH